MEEMRSEVPRHAEERRKMELQQGFINRNFTAGGESSMRKEAEEESGKRAEMQYEWMKRPEESESSYVKRLKDSMRSARGLRRGKNIVRRQREAGSEQKARTKPKVEVKDAEAGKAKPPVTDAGKPEESATEAGKAEDSVIGGSLKWSDSNRLTEPAAEPNSLTIQDDHVNKDKSALAKKMAEEEAKAYALFRSYWEHNCCNNSDNFQQITVLSPMLYTLCTPAMLPFNVAETLQIFSMELKLTDDNAGGFELPLSVYGLVAVRDTLDYKRNILFYRGRTVAQELTQDDPFLLLTGPSRAIVSMDKVDFEIYLKVKGAAASEDKFLITSVRGYAGKCGTALCFENSLCTLEVCLGTVKHAFQATIVGLQIVRKKESCPSNFRYGGLVACTPWTTADSGSNRKIVLIESKGRKMPQGDFGFVHLWRQVVCVEDEGGLDVVIQTYTKSGGVAAEGHVYFTAQNSHVSQQQCIVGEAQINVTVAWSVVPTNMDDVVYNV